LSENFKDIKNVLKDDFGKIKFGVRNKQQVFQKVKSLEKRRWMKELLPKSLSVALTVGFIFFAILFGKEFTTKTDLNNQSQQSDINDLQTGSQGTLTGIDLTKQDVQLLIANTEKHFKTVKGSFTSENRHIKEKVKYQLTLEEGNQGSYIHSNIESKDQGSFEGKETDITEIYDGNQVLKLLNKSQTYNKYQVPSDVPFAGDASISLFPNQVIENILNDASNWEIEDESSTVLDRNTVLIKGDFDKTNAKKFNASSFKFWVDSETGILLKLEYYDESGKTVETLVTNELEYNKPIVMDIFSHNIPKDYSPEK
jgi:hypothetical protein